MESQQKNPLLFAQNFANLPLVGVHFLVYRDLSEVVKRFVKGSKALDYGCGSGKSTRALQTLGFDTEGVDINEHMIKISRELDPGGMYHLIESAKIPADDNVYDLVYVGNVLGYASTKAEMLGIVKEIVRVLRPEGILIVMTTTDHTYRNKWTYITTDFEENKNPVTGSIVKLAYKEHDYNTYHYYYTTKDFYEVFSEAGLDVVCEHELLGKDTDGLPWTTEKELPIAVMYITRKKTIYNKSKN